MRVLTGATKRWFLSWWECHSTRCAFLLPFTYFSNFHFTETHVVGIAFTHFRLFHLLPCLSVSLLHVLIHTFFYINLLIMVRSTISVKETFIILLSDLNFVIKFFNVSTIQWWVCKLFLTQAVGLIKILYITKGWFY